MISRRILSTLWIPLLATAPGAAAPDAPPPPSVHVSAVETIPDLLQTDPAFRLPADGDQFCGPVAVANTLLWLAAEVDAALAPEGGAVPLVRALASRRFMATDRRKGTGPGKMMRGLSDYLLSKGHERHRIEYQGWRRVSGGFSVRSELPELDTLRRRVSSGRGAAFLHVGWYSYDGAEEEYRRRHGHWVTLVGYGAGRDGKPDPDVLVVHDPSPRAGDGPSSEYVRLDEVRSGRLVGRYKGLPRSAKGIYRLGGELRIHPRADVALLDGVMLLSLD